MRLFLGLLTIFGVSVGANSVSATTKAPISQYALANPHTKCKTNYRKETIKITLHDKSVRVVGCVYQTPKAIPVVTTTTTVQIPNQATTTAYDGRSSYVTSFPVPNGSPPSYVAQEYADVSVTAFPDATPAAGSVTFTDSAGTVICTAQLSFFAATTQVSCGASLTRLPIEPTKAAYSGTTVGWNDKHGTSYASSQGSGVPGIS